MGRQSGQHCLRPWILIGEPPGQGEKNINDLKKVATSTGLTSHLLLSQFADKFAEFKEAARLAKERSQEKIELTSTPSQVTQHSYHCHVFCMYLLQDICLKGLLSVCLLWPKLFSSLCSITSTLHSLIINTHEAIRGFS